MAVSADSPVLIVSGPPGVGKTTAARLLAAGGPSPTAHLEADAFFHFIRSGYVEPWKPESKEQNEAVMRVAARAAAGYAAAGYLTIVEGVFIPGWFLEPVRDVLRGEGHDVAFAVLRAPLEVCLGRVQAREGDPPIDRAAIEQIWRSFAEMGEFERNVLEVDGQEPDEVSALLARRVSEGLLRV
jgi:predicted kinase